MKLKQLTLGLIAASLLTSAPALLAKDLTPLNATPAKYKLLQQQAQIEVVFVLDTTGSMSGLIHAAKEKIWSIASTMASAQNAPNIKMGLVAYRDRGDNYVTQTVALSNDLDSMYASLMDFHADGGGDTPESVNQALDDAVNRMAWSDYQQTYKVIFLVGDAPAHMDYPDDVKYPQTLALAHSKGIIVNTIQAGQDSIAKTNWQQIALLGSGDYFQVEQSGNAVAIATPYDKKMAELSNQLDETRLYYGDEEAKYKQDRKVSASKKLHKEASEKSLARRASFNATASGKNNFLGEGELVEAISSGRVELDDIAKEELPITMQAMNKEQQVTLLKEKAQRRKQLEKQITQLAKQRDDYLKKEVAKLDPKKDSLDAKIFSSIRSQSKDKGLDYDDESVKY